MATYAAAPAGRFVARGIGRFVIYCPPRTGSDLLVGLLDEHPEVRCEGELLRTPIRQPLAFFDGRSAVSHIRGRAAWGCKIITQDLRWHPDRYGSGREFLERLDGLGYRILCIRRRDLLLQAMSLVHASATQYHFRAGGDHQFEPMRVDPEQLLYFLYALEVEDNEAAVSVEGLAAEQLWYEDDLLTPECQQATLDRITRSFGLDPVPAKPRVVAGAPPTLAERMTNLEEVTNLVAATRFAKYLPGP